MGTATGAGIATAWAGIARRPWMLTVMIMGCLPGAVDARLVVAASQPIPLEAVSFQDADKVGAVGTGCTWRGGPKMHGRMSMADDRGAIRRNGNVVAIRPAPDAKPLLLTYDRWTDGATVIRIRDTGRVVRRGYEFSETIASLELTENGRTRSYPGRLNCGS